MEEEKIEKLLETLAEGIIYILMAEKIKETKIDSTNKTIQNGLDFYGN